MIDQEYNCLVNTAFFPGTIKRVWIVGILGVLGVHFAGVGLYMLIAGQRLVECVIEYEDPPASCGDMCEQYLLVTPEHCRGPLSSVTSIKPESHDDQSIPRGTRLSDVIASVGGIEAVSGVPSRSLKALASRSDSKLKGELMPHKPRELRPITRKSIKGPVHLYYELEGFHQAMPMFAEGRELRQLMGEMILDRAALANCEPAISSLNNYLILVPCGLAATSVFNDTFVPVTDCEYSDYPCLQEIPMRDGVKDILWPNSPDYLYKNPRGEGIEFCDEWLPENVFPGRMENAHFQVWMKPAAFSQFRKQYGVIDQEVELPLRVLMYNRYPINQFNGKKRLVLSQISWFGARSVFVGCMYTFVGSLLMAFGVVCAGCRSMRRTQIKPSRA